MITDSENIKILQEFCKINGKQTTTWEVMKKVHSGGKDREHILIKRRIEDMVKDGLFFVNGDKKKHYQLITDNVKIKEIKFPDRKIHKSIWRNT